MQQCPWLWSCFLVKVVSFLLCHMGPFLKKSFKPLLPKEKVCLVPIMFSLAFETMAQSKRKTNRRRSLW